MIITLLTLVLAQPASILVANLNGVDVELSVLSGSRRTRIVRDRNVVTDWSETSMFCTAASQDGRNFLRLRPAGKQLEILVHDITGKQLASYKPKLAEPTDWLYGWTGNSLFAAKPKTKDSWSYWDPKTNKVTERSPAALPVQLKQAIAIFDGVDSLLVPRSAHWTAAILKQFSESAGKERSVIWAHAAIGSYSFKTAEIVSGRTTAVLEIPNNYASWVDLMVYDGRLLAIALNKSQQSDAIPWRPHLQSSLISIDLKTKAVKLISSAVSAVPLR